MKRVLLTTAYDGTAYHGFQIQKNDSTIAGELIRAVRDLTGEEVSLIGGSRTDAGVHALCNVTAFDTESPIPAEKFAGALNVRLPEDIRILGSFEVPADFHPLAVPSRKTYEYRILNAPCPDPTRRFYTLHMHCVLDEAKMNTAASYLTGEHDFASFCSAGSRAESTVRTIFEAGVKKEALPDQAGSLITIRVTGNGFLYNMVRIIAGTLIEVGRGAIAPEEVSRILDAKDRTKAGPTAPPQGLFLVKYAFPGLDTDFSL